MKTPFVYPRQVLFYETDTAQIVHFSNYFRYLEEAEHAFFRELNLPILWQREDGGFLGWPRIDAHLQFQAAASFGDLLEIRLWVGRVRASVLEMKMEIWREATLIAKGHLKIACCLTIPGTPMRAIEIPVEVAEVLRAQQASPPK